MMDDHETSDDAPSPEERAEAEALARALDGSAGAPTLPDDALEAAALLRYAAGDAELEVGRMDAILDEVLESVPAPAKGREAAKETTSPLAKWLKWLFPMGGLAAVAAVAMLAVMSQEPHPAEGGAPTRLPAPTVALLQAQAEAAGQGAEAGPDQGGTVALASAMGSYRSTVLGSLQERYGR